MRDRTAFQPQRFRVATWEEVAEFGRPNLRRRGLLLPMAGGAYGLVGSQGSVVQSASGAAISGLAYGQTPTAGNLLICWYAEEGSSTTQSTPSGWNSTSALSGTNCVARIFYKIAAGGDAVPSFPAITSAVQTAMLAEFSGNNGVQTQVLDESAANGGTTSPLAATGGNADLSVGELEIYNGAAFYSTAATKTLLHTPGQTSYSGATGNANNNGTSTVDHYIFTWGITASPLAVPFSDSFSFTTTKITGASVAAASFKLPATPTSPVVVSQAVQRAAVR